MKQCDRLTRSNIGIESLLKYNEYDIIVPIRKSRILHILSLIMKYIIRETVGMTYVHILK